MFAILISNRGYIFVNEAIILRSEMIELVTTCFILIISILTFLEGRLEPKLEDFGSIRNIIRDGSRPFYPILSLMALTETFKMFLGFWICIQDLAL